TQANICSFQPLKDRSPLVLISNRRISLALQPAEKPLFTLKHFLCLVAQSRNKLISRLREPRNPMRDAAVFLLVPTFAAPVVDLNTATFPITHRVPMNRFVWAQDLAGTDASVPPEFGNIVEGRENSSRNAVSLRISRSQQQKPPSGLQILDQRPNAIQLIRGDQSLLGKHIFKLFVIFVREG